MPAFRYRAVDAQGRVEEGRLDAADRAQAVEHLRGQGRTVLLVEEARGGARLPSVLTAELFGPRKPSDRELALWLRELATLLRAGLPLDRALDTIAQLGGKGATARLSTQLLTRVRGGASLADAMEQDAASFRRFAIGMVRAGEAAGALEIVVSRLADFMERANQLKDSVVSALIYPMLLMLTALATVILLLTVVLPRFQPLFEQAGKQLPLPTRVVLAAGDLVQASWWLAPLLALAVVLVLVRRAGDPGLRLVLDRCALRLPLLGRVLAELEVARLLRGLSTLLTNGVPVLAALAILRDTAGNEAVSRWVDAAADSLKRGKGLAEPTAAQPWFPPVAARLLAVGEETGRLDDMVGRAADMLDANAGRTVQRGLALLGPALTLVLGLVVAGVIAAILLAILKVNDLAM